MSKRSESITNTTLVQPINTGDEDMYSKIIKVSPDTHKKLLKLGAKGETFDHIINRLIEEHEKKHEKKGGVRNRV